RIGQPVIQRYIGNARDRSTTQCYSCRLAALVQQSHMRAGASGDIEGRPLGGLEESAVRPAPSFADEADPLGIGIGGHLPNERDVHLVRQAPTRCQSEAGSGLASFSCSATPPMESDPWPGFTHSSSTVPAAST